MELSDEDLIKPTPITVVFNDVNLTVDVKKRFRKVSTLKILNNVTGYVRPGHLLAVMGSSGMIRNNSVR